MLDACVLCVRDSWEIFRLSDLARKVVACTRERNLCMHRMVHASEREEGRTYGALEAQREVRHAVIVEKAVDKWRFSIHANGILFFFDRGTRETNAWKAARFVRWARICIRALGSRTPCDDLLHSRSPFAVPFSQSAMEPSAKCCETLHKKRWQQTQKANGEKRRKTESARRSAHTDPPIDERTRATATPESQKKSITIIENSYYARMHNQHMNRRKPEHFRSSRCSSSLFPPLCCFSGPLSCEIKCNRA